MKHPLFKAALLALSLIGLAGCDKVTNPQSTQSKVPADKKWTREEFTRLAMGQPDTVISATFGQPVLDNNYAGQFGILWTYKGITLNPANGQPDAYVTVVFENGKVAKVVFK